jgi:hypothetical protein
MDWVEGEEEGLRKNHADQIQAGENRVPCFSCTAFSSSVRFLPWPSPIPTSDAYAAAYAASPWSYAESKV